DWAFAFDARQPTRLGIKRGGQHQGVIELDPRQQGPLTKANWIFAPGVRGPIAVAVGTQYGGVYVYDIPRGEAPARMLRTFRGHSDRITWLGPSADGRYLATAAADGTVQIWNTQSIPELARAAGGGSLVERVRRRW